MNTPLVLVTGGCGFIGTHVVEQLVSRDLRVRVVDQVLRDRIDGVEYLRGDLARPDVAAQAVEGVDIVCHQASMVGLGVDFGDVEAYAYHNVGATVTMLRALHDRDFRGRIVLGSSMVVYGEGRYRCPEHGIVRPGPRRAAQLDAGVFEPPCPVCGAPLIAEAIGEDAPTDPRNVYATTKLTQELLCSAYAREHAPCSVTALRYHNVYGPRMPRDTPYAGVASLFRSAIARGEPPRVLEDGMQRRDFIHVRDIASANLCAMLAPDPYDGPLNIATGTPHTVLEMATALARASAGRPPVVTGEWRVGDVRHVFASPERAASSIGFRAAIAFEAGVREFAVAPLRQTVEST